MRIAMVGPFGLTPKQTMRSRAWQLAKPLAAGGDDVCLVMPPWHTPAEADKEWTEGGVHFRYVSLQGGRALTSRRLVNEVLRWQPDVVHIFKPKAYSGLVQWWLWQFQRRRLRLVLDSDDWEGWGGWNDQERYSKTQKWFFAWQEQWGMRHCHALTVASLTLQSIAWSMGLPPAQVTYIPNGPGISGKRAPKRAATVPTILVYSRLFEFDVEQLVKVLSRVKEEIPELQILLVGAGLFAPDGERLHQLLTAANLIDSVRDAGWVEPEALPELLQAGDVGIYLMADTLLNRTKCPVKLADMVSLGIPVVAERVGQVPEYVIHGRTGLLAAAGDTEGLAAAVIRLLQQPAERIWFGQNGVQHCQEQFAWEKLAAALRQVYQAVLAE